MIQKEKSLQGNRGPVSARAQVMHDRLRPYNGRMRVFATGLVFLVGFGLSAQSPPSPAAGSDPPVATAPAGTPGSTEAPAPKKAPKPKSRLKLLQQMQNDLDAAIPRAKVDEKGKKKLDKCHEVLIDAIAQQKRYKSVNIGKVNGCLNDLDKLDD